jgi:hypothetical protein
VSDLLVSFGLTYDDYKEHQNVAIAVNRALAEIDIRPNSQEVKKMFKGSPCEELLEIKRMIQEGGKLFKEKPHF